MALENKVIGREYISTTSCMVDEDGYWKAINVIRDRLLREGEDWVEETADGMGIDTNPQEAIKQAMIGVVNYLTANVHQKGFNGLVEFREYERGLKKARETNVVATPSEA